MEWGAVLHCKALKACAITNLAKHSCNSHLNWTPVCDCVNRQGDMWTHPHAVLETLPPSPLQTWWLSMCVFVWSGSRAETLQWSTSDRMQVEEDGCLPAAVGGAADGGEGEHCGGASIWLSSVSVCVCVCVSSKTARLRQSREMASSAVVQRF